MFKNTVKKIFTFMIEYDLKELRFCVREAFGNIVAEDEFYYVIELENSLFSKYHILKKFVNSPQVNKEIFPDNYKVYQKSVVYENELNEKTKLKISKEVKEFFYKENKEEISELIKLTEGIKSALGVFENS